MRRRRLLMLSLTLTLGLLSSSCRVEAKDLTFIGRDGLPLGLFIKSGKTSEGGRIELPADGFVRFYFASALTVSDDSSAFILTASADPDSAVSVGSTGSTGSTNVLIDIDGDSGPPVSSALPFSGGRESELAVFLPPGKYSGFTFRNPDKEAKRALFLHGLRIGDIEYRSVVGPDKSWAFSGILPVAGGDAPKDTVTFSFDSDREYFKKAAGLTLDLRRSGKEDGRPLTLHLKNKEKVYSAEIARRSRPETLHFYFDYLGFVPASAEIAGIREGETLELGLSFFDTKKISEFPEPLPGDLEIILGYPESAWRKKEFEVFRWSLFPEILVFDTASYPVQNSLFHRLAFFVEKKGFRGRLSPDKEIADRHGWNAHNYRAEDLAAFFNKAEKTGFILNKNERWLASFLVEGKVLKKDEAIYKPLGGGILSVSRESRPAHRRHLITHEAFHGAYYGIPEFRPLVERVWNRQSEAEKELWKYLLSWMQYDVKDDYLLINEFQAYLLQQPLESVDDYFRKTAIPRIVEKNPERKEFFARILAEHPLVFSAPARIFSDFLAAEAGLRAGEVFSIVPR